MINSEHKDFIVRSKTFRYPSPASQPKYDAPAGEASDIANNPYFKRDGRKHSPKTIHLSKQDLLTSGKDVAVGGFVCQPPPMNGIVYQYTVAKEQPPYNKEDYFPIVNFN